MKMIMENWRKFINEGFAGSKYQGGLPPELIDRYNEVESRLDTLGYDGSEEAMALEREYEEIEKKMNALGYEIIMGGHIARIDNGKIVAKRARFGEGRDRYLPPGEHSLDPTSAEEVAYEEAYLKVSDKLDFAVDNQGEIVEIKDGMYVVFDGEQYLVFDTPVPKNLEQYNDLYYKEDQDSLIDVALTDNRSVRENKNTKDKR